MSHYQQELAETVKAVITISKVHMSDPDSVHTILKAGRKTGRLVIDYNKGGISNITFESIEHIKPIDSSTP